MEILLWWSSSSYFNSEKPNRDSNPEPSEPSCGFEHRLGTQKCFWVKIARRTSSWQSRSCRLYISPRRAGHDFKHSNPTLVCEAAITIIQRARDFLKTIVNKMESSYEDEPFTLVILTFWNQCKSKAIWMWTLTLLHGKCVRTILFHESWNITKRTRKNTRRCSSQLFSSKQAFIWDYS